jgi:uncharacterized protein (DUF2267 family)
LEIQPGDFWEMTLPELLTEAQAKQGRQDGDYAGNLTRGDLDDLKEWMHGSPPADF